MVVKTSNSYRLNPGLKHCRSPIYSNCGNNGEWDHEVTWWWSQLTLAEQERLWVWEQWNWCVGGLLRMGGKSLLLPVWRSVGGGFNGKGELDAWVVRTVTWRPGNLHGSRMVASHHPAFIVSCLTISQTRPPCQLADGYEYSPRLRWW